METANALAKLQRVLLTWDYWDLVRKSEEGGGPFETLEVIPKVFTDVNHYKQVFEPLILEECCAQMLRGVEEGEVLVPHMCVSSKCEQKEDLTYARLVLPPGEGAMYSENDLVLLCKHNPMAEDDVQGNQEVQELHALGVCEGHEGEQSVRIKFRLAEEAQLGNAKGLNRVRALRAGIEMKDSCWWLLKLANMSTISREWVALQHAHLCPFIDIITGCKPRIAHISGQMDIPVGMSTTMEAQCNSSQMEALRAGLDGTPLVLIQGPPGTGKTRTILNLLSVIMHSAQKDALDALKGMQGQRLEREVLDPEQRDRLWRAQAPWLSGQSSIRDSITACDDPIGVTLSKGMGDDSWGLMRRAMPLRLGVDSGPKAHVLVCAPSNSALDEIVLRVMKSGLMDKDGNMYTPSIVRIGVNVHHSVRGVSLDAIVSARMGGEDGAGKGSGALSDRMERDRMRLAILDEASVVCSTLSFAGSSIFARKSRKFDVVVIDEAAQAVEPATLVPLITQGCKQVYLVGDPVQLPATVISKRALEHGYDCSLFKRLQEAGYPVKMLNTQYRMHPNISTFPSRQFYSGSLLDGESVHTETLMPWHEHKVFGPLAFMDVAGKESVPLNGASMQNKSEANMVLCIYRELVHRYPALRKTASVAVISPYKAQVKLIREAFKAAVGEEAAQLIDVNTIDGFQGREKDFCIFSCVRSLAGRTNKKKGIGFVADERRINVGITRARCSLIIIGNARALQSNHNWAALIHHCMSVGCLYRPQAPFADWMADAAAGRAEPIAPTPAELEALEKARKKLTHGTDVDVEPEVQDIIAKADLAAELHEQEMGGEDEGTLANLGEGEQDGKTAGTTSAVVGAATTDKRKGGLHSGQQATGKRQRK